MEETHINWSAGDLEALGAAASLLETQSYAMVVASKVGMPVESLMRMLPANAQHSIGTAVNRALERCLHVALRFDSQGVATTASRQRHSFATAATGALGGFFGLPGLLLELPVTTTVMLHSIAEIARAQGEDLTDPDAALSCLEVLALGPDGTRKTGVESAYYATRAALAQVTRDAAAYLAQKSAVKEGAPVLVSFLSKIAARFGLEVSEKAAAQVIPVAGAVGGLALNVMFMQHFQQIAEGHFIVRRLERTYGADAVHRQYEQLRAAHS
jgi:hypothetical protein